MKKFFFRVKQTLNITFRIRDTDEKTAESIQLSNITVQNHDYYKCYNIFAFSLSESSKDDSKRQSILNLNITTLTINAHKHTHIIKYVQTET